MCGITGIVGEVDKNLLKKMNDIISHRGPNDSGFFLDKDVGLGNRRLSIIGVASGKQPIHNEEETIWITFNGEIYNFLDLRKDLEEKGHKFYTTTDTEVIVHLYEHFGEECVKKLRGMFAFAIWDGEKNQLFLARDRLGIKPLYYTFNNGNLLFASEIKSILQDSRIKRKINLRSLHYFLTLRYPPGPETMFEGIYKLQPAHVLTYVTNADEFKVKRYWKLKMNPSNKSEKYYLDKFYEIFKESVKMRLMSEVPLGAYLSGGIDSSSVVAMMSEIMDEPVKTFSVGFGEERVDEINYSRFVADHFETDHHEFIVESKRADLLPKIVWHFDEPIADPAAIPVYILSKLAKKYVTVVLLGEGGDELFAGYEQYKIICNAEKYMKFIPSSLKSKFVSKIPTLIPTNFFDLFFKYSSSLGKEGLGRASECFKNIDKDVLQSYLKIVSIFDEEELQKLYSKKNTNKMSIKNKYLSYFKKVSEKNRLNSLILLETEIQLPDNLLMKNDKMTMAYSIEGRVPFLDFKLMEFAGTVPQNLKLKGTTDKYLLRRAMSRLVPKVIINRKKHRFFVPIDTWLEGELGEIVKQLFSKENVERIGLFNYSHINHIMKNFNTSPLFYGRQIWNLLTFELWRRIFINGRDIKKPKLSLNQLL